MAGCRSQEEQKKVTDSLKEDDWFKWWIHWNNKNILIISITTFLQWADQNCLTNLIIIFTAKILYRLLAYGSSL